MDETQPKSFEEQLEQCLKGFNDWISSSTSLEPVSASDFIASCRRSESFKKYWAPDLELDSIPL